MQKLLVPTDFSEAAFNAYQYAIELAYLMNIPKVQLIHVYSPEVEGDYPTVIPPVQEYMDIRKKRLEEFKGKINSPDDITIQTELLIGFPVDEIVKQSTDSSCIVMSTTGEGGLLEKIFGSVSSAVAQKSRCPVFLIPPKQNFQMYENILYASNYESADEDMIEAIMEFNKQAKASLHFVHVKDGKEEHFKKTKEEIFEELFDDGQPNFSFELEEVEANSVASGLNQYAEKNPIDLVVMVNKQRSFWERLFHKSKVREMVFAAQKPIMVMHL